MFLLYPKKEKENVLVSEFCCLLEKYSQTKLQHSAIDIHLEMLSTESKSMDHYLFIVVMILKISPGIT